MKTIVQPHTIDVEVLTQGRCTLLSQDDDVRFHHVYIDHEALADVAAALIEHAIAAGSLSDDHRAALLALLQPQPALTTLDPIRCESLRRLAQAEQDGCND